MSKKSVVFLFLITILIALAGVLFGVVFCLRSQSVVIIGETEVSATQEEIIKTAGLKQKQSIFMIDKDKAISKIEKEYSHIKVVQIKTTSLTKVEIHVRARIEMFCTEYNGRYYVLDEDLKVLNITTEQPEDNLIHINPTILTKEDSNNNALNLNEETDVCDFVGTSHQQKVVKGLQTAMMTVVTKITGEGENATKEYLTREDVCDFLEEIQFVDYNSYNKLLIKTKFGVILDIEKPTKDLNNKINI